MFTNTNIIIRKSEYIVFYFMIKIYLFVLYFFKLLEATTNVIKVYTT